VATALASETRAHGAADRLWLAGLAFGLPLLGLCLLGFDASWDLRNYHLYNPHAWLHGRWAIDLAPAQLQSWHNPLLDLPFYLLASSGLSTVWSALWLLLPSCVAMLAALLLFRKLAGRARDAELLLALLVLGGAGYGSLLATTSNDAFVAAAMMCSLLLVASTDPDVDDPRWQYAGLLAGGVAGLKPTALVFCLALGVAAICYGPWNWRGRARRLARLSIGGMAGFAFAYGWWGWHLYRSTGNPLFPYFNDVFASPLALPQAYTDQRFLPSSKLDGLLSPVQLLSRSQRFCEIRLKDPRLLLALLGFASLWWLERRREPKTSARIVMLLAFAFSGWLLWRFEYGIYRYAMPLEMLGALALALLVHRFDKWRAPLMLLALLLVTADTRRPNWGRSHEAAPRLGVPALLLPRDAMLLSASDDPLAYLALGLRDTTPYLAVGSNITATPTCIGLKRRAAQAIAAHRGSYWLLADASGDLDSSRSLLERRYGLSVVAKSSCRRLHSSAGEALLCPLHRIAPARACTPD
jgi:hypothetical protein